MSKRTLNVGKHLKAKKYEKFIPLSTEFIREHNILDPEKVELIELLQTDDFDILKIIGGKGSGKTIVAKAAEHIFMENNPKGSTFDARKYKDQASEKLGGYFQRWLKLVSHHGYKNRWGYEQKRHRFYNMKDNKYMHNNSYQQYFSLDSVSDTDGSAPENLGFYGMLHIDEPIIKEDMLNPDKIPKVQIWNSDIEQIRSNLERYNEEFALLHKVKLPQTKEIYTLNDWGKHPLSVDFNQYFSQDQFIKKITGYNIRELMGNKELLQKLCKSKVKLKKPEDYDILKTEWAEMWLKRHTYYVKNTPKKEILCRMTYFANPMQRVPNKARKALVKLAEGFLKENWALLAHYGGLQFQASPDSELLVYNIQSFNEISLKDLLKEGWIPKALSYGVDLDTSRVNTIAPIYKLVRDTRMLNNKWKTQTKIHIDKIIELPANGSGEFGEMHELTAKQIAMTIKKHFIEALKNPIIDSNLENTYAVVDDNRKHYLKMIKESKLLNSIIRNWMPATKQGHYEIQERQDYFETSFHKGIITLDPRNVDLKEDFRLCVKASKNQPVRTTAGNINYLDRIDATEYGAYPFLGVLVKTGFKYQQMKKENAVEERLGG